jgi:hypothetical protein
MGVIQTYYYLAIIAVSIVVLTLICSWYAVVQLRPLFREGGDRLVAWLITGTVALMVLFIVVTSAAVLVGFITHGSSQS